MDQESGSSYTNLYLRFQAATDCTEVQERRRTFWAVFTLICLTEAVCGQSKKANDQDITTHLPSADFERSTSAPDSSISLHKFIENPQTSDICLIAGVAVAGFLYRSLLSHARSSQSDSSYDFWTHHYKLDALIKSVSIALDYPLSPKLDPQVMFLTTLIHTSTILAHRTAFAYANNSAQANNKLRTPNILTDTSPRCLTAATSISQLMRLALRSTSSATQSWYPNPTRSSLVLQLDPLVIPCLSTAMQALPPVLRNSNLDTQATEAVQVLFATLNAMRRGAPCVDMFMARMADMEDLHGISSYAEDEKVQHMVY
ncbi:hypothetical protein K432DRAFT_428703 [Lepidopterella palustris CBS 459.81]|uniref:Transcription factor domain-containing protein n=1 Tax=Lepidopterella palustris CBS 459.81 TaxID=1314670 RepID=A0A8E2E355_9PEZI|nr:hypothetical protein K432DRAFT_428703 [Lepidopterella palustris CBS 459.81]